MQGRSKLLGGAGELIDHLADFLNWLVAHQAGNWQGQPRQHLAIADCNHPALHIDNLPDGKFHAFIIHPGDHQVVMIVSHRAGQGATFNSQTFQQTQTDFSGPEMAFDHGHFGDIAPGVGYYRVIPDRGSLD